MRAVTVDALDDRAASFYRHFGFEPTELAPNILMVPFTRCDTPSGHTNKSRGTVLTDGAAALQGARLGYLPGPNG